MEIYERDNVNFFVGNEIENTPAKGQKTLFVVGLQMTDVVINHAKEQNVNHIFVGASQSFKPAPWQMRHWDNYINELIEHGLTVSLDFDIKYLKDIQEFKCFNHVRFIPIISIMFPGAHKMNPNTTIKFDDSMYIRKNPGVWCIDLKSTIEETGVFTSWDEYGSDEQL